MLLKDYTIFYIQISFTADYDNRQVKHFYEILSKRYHNSKKLLNARHKFVFEMWHKRINQMNGRSLKVHQ